MSPAFRLVAAPRHIRFLFALVFLTHFCVGAWTGLSVDEAHYALYALHPALSYFDHPPLVGWLQWPLVALDAPTALLRLIPELLWLATAAIVYQLAERLQGSGSQPQQAGFWAVLALALAPLLHVLGIGLLPDSLLMFFTVAVMRQTLELMDKTSVQRPAPWLVLGLLLGLAGLSKYTAIFAAAAVGVCLLAEHGGRVLLNKWLWLAGAIALLLVAPVGVWNYQNHWISFTYQAQHGAGGGWQALNALRFLLLQLLVYGPLLLWGWVGLRQAGGRKPRYLRVFFLIPFVVLAALAGGGSSLPHWTAPAWVALAPFAGMALATAVQHGRYKLILVLATFQALLCLGLLGLMVSAGVPIRGTANTGAAAPASQPGVAASNPFADLHGWDAAGQRARALAEQHQLQSVAVQNWTLASRLGWYARPLPVHVLDGRFDQFHLWVDDLPVGGSTLLLDWSQMSFELPVTPHGFANCTLVDTQPVTHLGRTISSFRFYVCRGWSGDPQPRRISSS